jgi:hypothetical protein
VGNGLHLKCPKCVAELKEWSICHANGKQCSNCNNSGCLCITKAKHGKYWKKQDSPDRHGFPALVASVRAGPAVEGPDAAAAG